jgi:flavin-dependent dehydrogenase
VSRPEIVIAGGGPAGATAAILLAAAGARVRVLDKAVFPREKLCGEFVSPEAIPILARTGLLPSLAARASRMSEAVFTSPSGKSLRLPVPDASPRRAPPGSHRAVEALGIPRLEMDAALLARAAALGADVVEGFEARALGFSEGRAVEVRGHARGGAGDISFPARAILAADGRDSTLARLVDPLRRRRPASPRFGIKAHYRGVTGLRGRVELHWFRGGYVGLTDLGEGRANVCSLIDRSVAGDIPREPERIVRELFFTNPCARARLAAAERVSDWHAVGSLVFRSETPARAGVLFLGDAAGTIDPFAGEGMSMAFRSAEIAVEEILRDPARAPVRYAPRWRAEFSRRIAFSRGLGRFAIRPAFQGPLIGILARAPSLGRLLARGTRAGLMDEPLSRAR